jgi:NAD(P)H dehydrogenase (quinone)
VQTVFLIGATGNIGGHLLHELAPDHAAGRLQVRVAARSATARRKIIDCGAVPVDFDLDDPGGFDAALAGSETVFLLRPYTIKQLMQGKQVIDAAVRVGVRAIVLIGAHGHQDTPHPVIGWNFLVEAYAERSGLAWTHLRPNFFMDNMLAQRHEPSHTIFNRLVVPVSWISSEDIAAVAAAVLRDPAKHAGRAYSLATDCRSVAGIAEVFTEVTGIMHHSAVPAREHVMERLLAQGREPVYAAPLVEFVDAINAGLVPDAVEVFDTVETVAGRKGMDWGAFLRKRLLAS